MTVLITAESIVAGFMIAYGALNGQLLVDWSRHHGSLMTTYIAGIVVYAIVLTCFVSIVLLFNSLHTNRTIGKNKEEEKKNKQKLDWRYDAGYDLFLMAILGSAVFVVTNGISIHQFTVASLSQHRPPKPISCFDNSTFYAFGQVAKLADVLYYEFLFYPVFLFLLLLVFPRIFRWLAQTMMVHELARTKVVHKLSQTKLNWFARTRHRLLIVLLIAVGFAVGSALLCVPDLMGCISK